MTPTCGDNTQFFTSSSLLSFVWCLTKCFTFFILLVLGGCKPLVSIAINHLKGSLCSLQRTSHTHRSKDGQQKNPTTTAQKGKKEKKNSLSTQCWVLMCLRKANWTWPFNMQGVVGGCVGVVSSAPWPFAWGPQQTWIPFISLSYLFSRLLPMLCPY